LKRIVYTIAVGKPKFAECALGLGRSLKLIGDTTHRVVITDQPNYPWTNCFDEILAPEDPFEWTLFSKLGALQRTDADQVLFIDCDCLVFKRLDPIFEYCRGRGLSVQGKLVNDGDWYGRVADHLNRHGIQQMPQFNGGMIYYERTMSCQALIEACRCEGKKSKDSGFLYDSPLVPEEPYVSLAIAKAGLDVDGNAHLIPEEMDFTNTATGLIGKLELDVFRNRCSFVCRRFDVRHVQPIIFHASRYINYTAYWKQLDTLAWLEKYSADHPFGYMSPTQKLVRSIQRRYLKLTGRLP